MLLREPALGILGDAATRAPWCCFDAFDTRPQVGIVLFPGNVTNTLASLIGSCDLAAGFTHTHALSRIELLHCA